MISPQVCPLSLPGPLFETHCSYVEARLAQFLSWNQNQAEADVGPFIDYPKSEFWAYADYKYIAVLFQDFPSMFEVAWAVYPSADDDFGADYLNDDGISIFCYNLGPLTTYFNITRGFHFKYLVQNVSFSSLSKDFRGAAFVAPLWKEREIVLLVGSCGPVEPLMA